MNPDTMTLFDRMDGDRILPEAIRIFNEKVTKDPVLMPFFETLDKEAVVEHQKLVLMVKDCLNLDRTNIDIVCNGSL